MIDIIIISIIALVFFGCIFSGQTDIEVTDSSSLSR